MKILEEMLRQESQFHTAGVAYGQHSALSLVKTDEKSQEIKFFSNERATAYQEKLPEPSAQLIDTDLRYERADEWIDNGYYPSNVKVQQDNEEEELITDILERKLAFLFMAFQPPEPVEGPADTLFIVSKSKEGWGANQRVLVRAHSKVLKRYNDAFNELICYHPPAVSTPEWEMQENEIYTSIMPKIVSSLTHKSNDWWKMSSSSVCPIKSEDEEWQGIDANDQAKNPRGIQWYGTDGNTSWQEKNSNNEAKDQRVGSAPTEVLVSNKLSYGQRGSVHFKEDEFLQHKKPSMDLKFLEKNTQCPSQAFMDNGVIDLELEHVIKNLQDSQKPLVVKEFLDASNNIIKLSGWEHLPFEVKESFKKFASSIISFKNPGVQEGIKALNLEYNTSEDDERIESNFLGMVGRRQNKKMVDILNNITQGIANRKKSSMMLASTKNEEEIGTFKDVSTTIARTELERRKSASYLENQEKRKSIVSLEPRKNISLIATQDKRINPSFLERRQSKVLLEMTQRKKEKFDADDMNMRRRTSKGVILAFERQKDMSILESKRTACMNFNAHFDGGHNGSQNILPLAKNGQRVSATSHDLLSNTTERATKDKDEQTQRLRAIAKLSTIEGMGRRKSNVSFIEKKGSKSFRDMKQKKKKEWLLQNSPPPLERRPSQPPLLKYIREEDKQRVVCFYEDEDADTYETSSSYSVESELPPLPKDVEYVIEKRHWTADILYAILEFIYTEVVHLNCEEIPDVYAAANEILLSSLMDAIRLKPIIQYYNLAMVNEHNRVALLNLANQLTMGADFKNYVNKNKDFHDLKRLCEAYSLMPNAPNEQKPYTLLLETAHIAFRHCSFVKQGLHDINGEMILILKNPREGTRLFKQNLEQQEYLTFKKKLSDRHNEKQLIDIHWMGRWSALQKTRNHHKAWKIMFFNFSNVYRDIPLKNYIFYKHITTVNCRPWAPEVFSIRMIVGLLICPILFDALFKTFPKLEIKTARGAGYYMAGETYGNSITLTGAPIHLLQACRSCPRHMIGRTVLRVSSPSELTFVKLWTSTNRFGVDLDTNVLYFLKPLIQIQKILEHWHELDLKAKFDIQMSREIVELVEPHDPF